jgi:uncharacterized protein (DUF2235 family)
MSKNIVICSDGTGQTYGVKNSNVARLLRVLDLGDERKQIATYDPGVGSLSDVVRVVPEAIARQPGFNPITQISQPTRLDVWKGQLFGSGLIENVQEMYNWLSDHYENEDRIFLFGFSRGAFTVRVLAGLLARCGLLPKSAPELFREAFELYKPHDECAEDVRTFRSRYARNENIEIEFLGLWDTVKSYGYMLPRSLPHTRYNGIVKNVRHALSLGEKRSFFIPTTWGGLDAPYDKVKKPQHPRQTVREIWFAGDHSDVGGGHDNEEGYSAARFSLDWMIQEASDKGLVVDPRKVENELETLLPKNRFTKTHDLLKQRWGWKFSELLPRGEFDNSRLKPKLHFKWGPLWPPWPLTLLRGRRHPEQYPRQGKIFIHRSVQRILDPQRVDDLLAKCNGTGVRVEFVSR